MGLITQEVEVVVGNNKKYFLELGYTNIFKGLKIVVPVADLQNSTHTRVDCVCDGEDCGILLNMEWRNFLKYQRNGYTYCNTCAHKLFGRKNMMKTRLENGTSFYQMCINNDREDILNRLDYELNNFDPKEILCGSNRKAYFKCPQGIHESEEKWLTNIPDKNYPCIQCNSLAHNYPEFINTWAEYNKENPEIISRGSGKNSWWKCENNIHEDYERSVSEACYKNFRCPDCVRERDESFLQEKVRLYLEKICDEFNYELNHEKNCYLKCINPKTQLSFYYDNEIMSNNFYLVVETQGEQHYRIVSWHRKLAKKHNITPQEQFEYTQWKDEYKKQNALKNGYYYLAIPYWADDENQTYKLMIDDMLNYIYENIKG